MSELKNAVQLSNPLMEEYVAKNIPYMAILETTGKCTGSCLYCYSISTGVKSGNTHSKETLMRVVDECKQRGVSPCTFMQLMVVGNINQESLVEIFNRERDRLLFNFEIKGLCGECENNDVCFGCRANALLFCGDVQASDPKCWLNPANKEEYALKK